MDGSRQQALSEAQRYPADDDGIVAGDPGNYRIHLIDLSYRVNLLRGQTRVRLGSRAGQCRRIDMACAGIRDVPGTILPLMIDHDGGAPGA